MRAAASTRLRLRLTLLALVLVTTACAGSEPLASTPPPTIRSTTTRVASEHAPDSGFAAFGDAGTGRAKQRSVAGAIERWVAAGHRVDALVETGDAVYRFGAPSRFDEALDEPYAELRATRPLWITLGNHDVAGGFEDQLLEHLALPRLPYTKTLAGVQLLFLDANRPDDEQARWLDERLGAPGPALRVVVFHQPAYSCAEHGSTDDVIDKWVPVLERHRVALVLNGHDHYYERFLSERGVTYVVTGGGGAALYQRRSRCDGVPPSQETAERHHFVGVEVRGSTLALSAVAADGTVLDRATIVR